MRFFLHLSFWVTLIWPFCSYSCFSLLAGRKATASGKVILARTSDSKDARRSKNFKIYTSTDGTKLYTGLPYSDLENDPLHDMAQVTTNQFGVALSATQTIQNHFLALSIDPPTQTEQSLSEANIPSIVMPTATSARDGVRLLGHAIETYGIKDNRGFGVLLGDRHEAWYLETLSGHQWVAIRVPDHMYFVAANGPGQIQEYEPKKYAYLFSHYQEKDPIVFAEEAGFAQRNEGIFNFRSTYGEIDPFLDRQSHYIRIAYAQHLLNPSTRGFDQSVIEQDVFPMFLVPEHPIQIDDIKAIQSSHYQDFPEFDPYQSGGAHPRYRPISTLRTSNAHITEIGTSWLYRGNDYSYANLEYIALGMPALSVYIPIYYGITHVPTALQSAANHADDNSLFWQFRKIQVLVFLQDEAQGIPYEWKERQAYVQTQYRQFNQYLKNKQHRLEQHLIQSHAPNLIDIFTQVYVEALSQVNQHIISHFLKALNVEQRYGLNTPEELNYWFTERTRIQECYFRSEGEFSCADITSS